MMEPYKSLIIDNNSKHSEAFYKEDEIKVAQTNLMKLLQYRNTSVINQINKKENNIHIDFDLRSLGGLH